MDRKKEPDFCQVGSHRNGTSWIDVHVVSWNKLCCIACAAGSVFPELIRKTQEDMRRPENYPRIHAAGSSDHSCEYF